MKRYHRDYTVYVERVSPDSVVWAIAHRNSPESISDGGLLHDESVADAFLEAKFKVNARYENTLVPQAKFLSQLDGIYEALQRFGHFPNWKHRMDIPVTQNKIRAGDFWYADATVIGSPQIKVVKARTTQEEYTNTGVVTYDYVGLLRKNSTNG